MDSTQVKKALVEAIEKILRRCEVDVPEFADDLLIVDIEGFKSKMWPYIMSELADQLTIDIPENMNIFFEGKGKTRRKRTLSEVVNALIRLSEGRGS